MKKNIYFLGALALLLLVVYFGGKAFANSKLDGLIEKSNQDGNSLTIGKRDLSFNFYDFGIKLDSVQLDQTAGDNRISGTISHIDLSGLSVAKVIGGEISISDLLMDGADLEIHPVVGKPDSTAASDKPDKEKKKISVMDLRLANGRILSYDKDGVLKAEVLGLSSNGALNLPLAPATAPKMVVKADSIYFPATDDTYQSISYLKIDVGERTLNIGTFKVTPTMTARSFLTSIKYKRTWQALRLGGIEASSVPFDSLFSGGRSVIPDVTIKDLSFAIYENPSLERDPAESRKLFPVEKFRKLGESIWVHSITVDHANIAYGVHKEGAERPDITFAGKIKAGNFSTWKQDDPAFLQMDCTFDETSPLTVRFNLDQAGDGRDFTATGELKDYDLPKINPLMVVAANADIEKGHVYHMTHDFSVRNGISEGKLTFEYDHLEVKMTGKKAWLINLIEDIAIRDSNPRNDGELVIGTVYAEHEPTKSFFNLYWKSLVSGMTSSVAGKVFTPKELTPK